LYAILGGIVPFALEIDQAFIAAILTVIGYSINDSVVVFDRVREYLRENKSEKDTASLINTAINDTLSRTIVTSLTTILVILILFLFGGDALRGFTFALLIGVIVGTYSSACIATPIVVDVERLTKKKEK
jgi:SecD/SecF fusion protein